MSDSLDERLGSLLREDSPPARDALFRIRLIERREQQKYRQRATMRIAAMAALIVLPALVLSLVTEPLTAVLLGVFGAAVLAATVLSFRGLRQAMRWIRSAGD